MNGAAIRDLGRVDTMVMDVNILLNRQGWRIHWVYLLRPRCIIGKGIVSAGKV